MVVLSVMGCGRHGERVLTVDAAGGGSGCWGWLSLMMGWCWPLRRGHGHGEWSSER